MPTDLDWEMRLMRAVRSKQLLAGVLGLMLCGSGCVSICHERDFDSAFGTPSGVPLLARDFSTREPEPKARPLRHPQPHPGVARVIHEDCGESHCDCAMPSHPPAEPLLDAVSGLRSGAGHLYYRALGAKHDLHSKCTDWRNRRKEKSNPPPWPKFHPVPAKPVFESDTTESLTAPDIFGAFGPS
ncbi:hypothetical protein SH449x_004033 [Pirellulaceae bacterium SH449]